jgi:hypothetical protein
MHSQVVGVEGEGGSVVGGAAAAGPSAQNDVMGLQYGALLASGRATCCQGCVVIAVSRRGDNSADVPRLSCVVRAAAPPPEEESKKSHKHQQRARRRCLVVPMRLVLPEWGGWWAFELKIGSTCKVLYDDLHDR